MIRSLPRLGSVKRPLITAIGTRIQPGVGFAPTPASRHDSFTTHAARRDKDDSHLPSFLEPTITDDRVSELAAKPLQRFTLADLVRHGKPPLSPTALLASANFTLSLLPIRLAHRIHALRNLPYIVVANPSIASIYQNYQHSLSTLLPYCTPQSDSSSASPYKSSHAGHGNEHLRIGPSITTLEQEERFTSILADLVETHRDTIPILARGFLESRKYISPAAVTSFLDSHLRARIGTRLIAEQHIALHHSSQPRNQDSGFENSSYNGVIDTKLCPARIVEQCANFVAEICELKYGIRPRLIIDGQPETTISYVPVHLEYIVTELLKNAFRATVESGSKEPVVVTIAAEPPSESEEASGVLDQGMGDDNSAPGVTIRIRDRGGGIQPRVLKDVWSYSFTTFEGANDEGRGGGADHPGGGGMSALDRLGGPGGVNSSIAGLGYGLPLSRAYAEYFGGGIAIQSLWGWGCDVYLRLKGVGRV